MDALRTPDDRFDDLPGYPFAPHYVEVADGDGRHACACTTSTRGHADARRSCCCCTASRRGATSTGTMIPVLVDAGLRAVAPDLVGFGRSDKPTHAHRLHVRSATSTGCARTCSTSSTSRDITLVCQDWGGLIGLRLVAEHPDRFARVVAANTFLPTGDRDPGEAFLAWQKFSPGGAGVPRSGAIVNGGCTTDLARRGDRRVRRPVPRRDVQGRRAPVPVARADARPTIPRAEPNRAAWEVARGSATSRSSPRSATTTRSPRAPSARLQSATSPERQGQPHTTIAGGGHFLQEDRGEELAAAVVEFVKLS